MILHRVGGEGRGGTYIKTRNQPRSFRRAEVTVQRNCLSGREECADQLLCWIRTTIARTSPLADRFSPKALLRMRDTSPLIGVPTGITEGTPQYTWDEINQIIGRAPSHRNRMALGVLWFMANRYLESAESSLSIAKESGDVALRAMALTNAAESLSLLSEHDLAWQCTLEAVSIMPERPANYVTVLSTAVLSRRPGLLLCAKGLIMDVEGGASNELQSAALQRRRRVEMREVRSRIDWKSCMKEVRRTCPELIEAQYV